MVVKGSPQKIQRAAAIQRTAPGAVSDGSLEGNLKQVLADEQFQEAQVTAEPDKAYDADSQAPLIKLVNSILLEAIKRNTSDIHLEPFENVIRIRFRIDGVLQEIQKIPIKLGAPIVSRLKIMADLDICEKRIPQDGSIRFKSGTEEADLRVSTLPSAFGEKIVMRVLGKTNLNNDLSKLNIPEAQLNIMRQSISRPDGLVLVTGPTGSGKTTTLYAAVNEVNDISVSVFTAEDPIEGNIAGVTQCGVNQSVGYTFASMLRAFLRQDPDIILVGEIRDQETAEIAIKASLTGHLVLSTLHTNCAVSTITRLIDMGVPPYLVASSLNCVVAQRLVRRICSGCKQEIPVSADALKEMGVPTGTFTGDKIFRGKGCSACHKTGYKGRIALYEVLKIDDDIRRAIIKGMSKVELKKVARSLGMVTLREAGFGLVNEGFTTIDEVLGVTNEDEESLLAAEQELGFGKIQGEEIGKSVPEFSQGPSELAQVITNNVAAIESPPTVVIEAQGDVAKAISSIPTQMTTAHVVPATQAATPKQADSENSGASVSSMALRWKVKRPDT